MTFIQMVHHNFYGVRNLKIYPIFYFKFHYSFSIICLHITTPIYGVIHKVVEPLRSDMGLLISIVGIGAIPSEMIQLPC